MSPFGRITVLEMDYGNIVQSALICDQCKMMSVGTEYPVSSQPSANKADFVIDFWTGIDFAFVYPKWVQGQEFDDVPQIISNAATEAHKARSIEANLWAVLIARTVVEAVAKDQGVITGSLFEKIDAMAVKGLIIPFTVKTAHVIRVFGNDMAHEELGTPVDATDADGVLGFMDEILNEVYQAPRQARSASGKSRGEKAINRNLVDRIGK